MKVISMIMTIVIFCLGMALSLFNPETIIFHYGFDKLTLPLSLLLVLVLIAGAFLGALSIVPLWCRAKHQKRQINKQLLHVQKELDNLRAMPMTDGD